MRSFSFLFFSRVGVVWGHGNAADVLCHFLIDSIFLLYWLLVIENIEVNIFAFCSS